MKYIAIALLAAFTLSSCVVDEATAERIRILQQGLIQVKPNAK